MVMSQPDRGLMAMENAALTDIMLTRAELYELVWRYPLTELARQLRVDDALLAKTCNYYYVPRPPPGYWQKIAYGKPVERDALDNCNFSATEEIIISSRLASKTGGPAP